MVAKGPDMMTGPDSTSATAVASASLKETGCIFTRGSSTLSDSSRSGTPYMWDEPWSGDNAPRMTLNPKIEEEDADKIDLDAPIVTTVSAKTAHRVSITPQRANKIRVSTSMSVIRSSSRTGLKSIVAEESGIGILPDVASSGISLPSESSTESNDDLDLPIQGTPVSEFYPREVRSSGPYIDNRLSWLQLDFDYPPELDGPQTIDAAPDLKRLSWLHYRTHGGLYENQSKGSKKRDKNASVEVGEDVVKPLDMQKGVRRLDRIWSAIEVEREISDDDQCA